MRPTLFWLCTLCMTAGSALAEEFVHETSGLSIRIPDQWDRDRSRERGSIAFSAICDLAKGKQIRFEVSAGLASGFDAAEWLDAEKEEKLGRFAEQLQEFSIDKDRTVGGKGAVGYSVAGKASAGDGNTYLLRYRVYAVVNGDVLLHFTELSYNDAQQGQEALLQGMWDAVTITEPTKPKLEIEPPEGAVAADVVDEKGNYRLRLPAGWTVREGPSEQDDAALRLTVARENAAQQVIAVFDVVRFRYSDTGVFARETPSTVIQGLREHNGLFDVYYGPKATFRIDVDESVLLGGADKSCAYRIKDWTAEQYAEIRKAEEDRSRGLKVEVPNPPKRVIRGRLAMLSPCVYVIRAEYGDHADADNGRFLAELNEILDSFEFLAGGAKLPALEMPNGERLGNTVADPRFAKERKDQIQPEAFDVAKKEKDKPSAVLQVKFTVPEFFQLVEGLPADGALKLMMVAQDKNNNWVRMQFIARHTTELPIQSNGARMSFEDKKQTLNTWRSNWEGSARGKFPADSRKSTVGGVNFEVVEVTGTIDNFPAGKMHYLAEKWGWHMEMYIETRGGARDVFKDQIKDLVKGLRFSKR